MNKLGANLNRLAAATNVDERLLRDPVSFPRRFRDPRDIEVAAWLASALAYGRVGHFLAALERVLEAMGGKPCEFVSNFDPRAARERFKPLYYRLNSGLDIACLLYFMHVLVKRYGSIGARFQGLHKPSDEDIAPALEAFVREILAIDPSPVYGSSHAPKGLGQFLSLPSKGSACKRLNLYLRWMVRPDDGVDFGLWPGISPSKLVVPLDTHVLRISRYLGLTRRRTANWATAKQITQALKRFQPADPLAYDFSLCHHGISGNCPSARVRAKCQVCVLRDCCAKGRMLLRK